MNDRETKEIILNRISNDRSFPILKTYIIETNEKEYYCGKTNNIDKRLKEHLKEKRPHWFSFKNRKQFQLKTIIKGDYEKEIKRFGVKKYLESIKEVSLSWKKYT